MTEWYVALMVLIAVAFAVVLWRFLRPAREDRLERDARLPLEDVGRSDLDEPAGGGGRDEPPGP